MVHKLMQDAPTLQPLEPTEALKQARAAEVPIIVAITKTDASGAQIERVKQELSQVNLLPEEWGGTRSLLL